MFYVIETPIAQPSVVTPGGAVDITVWLTSDENINVDVAIAILDGSTVLQELSWQGSLPAFIRQPVTLTFIAAGTANPQRNVRVIITDYIGTVQRTFNDIFTVGMEEPEFTVVKPVATPYQVRIGETVLISSLMQVNYPGTYTVVINVHEGSGIGWDPGRFLWGKSQRVTFGASAKTVSISGPAVTFDGDNRRRDIAIKIYSGAAEIYENDWDDIYWVLEYSPDFEMMDPYPIAVPKYVPVNTEVQVTARLKATVTGQYNVVFLLKEESLWLVGEQLYPPISVSAYFVAGQWKDVSFTHLCTLPSVGTTGVDIHVDIYDVYGDKIWEDEYGRRFDIGIVEVADFEMQDYYPQASPVFVPIGGMVTVTSRIKAALSGQYKFIFMLYEEALAKHGEELYPPIEVDAYLTAGVFADVTFSQLCTLPVRVGEGTGVDIHIDIYSADELLWEDEYGRVFDLGFGAVADFEMQAYYPQASPVFVPIGERVEITSRIKATLSGQYKFIFMLYEEALAKHGEELYPPIEVDAYLTAGVFTDVVFSKLCTLPVRVREGTGVDIHLDIYAADELLWEDEYGRVFELELGEVPPEYDLIQHTIYPYAYIYTGDVEVTTATFKTDPFTPAAWMADTFSSKLEDEVRARGGRPLELKVYVDKSPLLWTNFKIEVVGTPLGAEVASGIAVGIPIWLAIILVCLAIIAVIIVATLAIKTIVGLFTTYPGLHDVKPGWGKETLILAIQDSEEFWERPLTPLATLEGMSEAELRDHLDQIAEEEVEPEVAWLPLAIVGGLGVLGVGAAVALTTRRE